MPSNRPRSPALSLLGFGALTAGAALVGTLAAGKAKGPWYRALRKPAFQPPPQLFGPVWTALYALIAYSGHRVYEQPVSTERTRALSLWGGQLCLNALWTPLFFGKHNARASLVDTVALTGTVTAYAVCARQVDGKAALAVVPYLAWTAFATVLNEEVVRLNPRFLTA